MKINPTPDAVKGDEIYLLRALCRELYAGTFWRLRRYFKSSLHSLVQSTGLFTSGRILLVRIKKPYQYSLSFNFKFSNKALNPFLST